MSLWCSAPGSTSFETEGLFLCPWGRPWLAVCPESLPAGSTCRRFRSSWRGHLSLVLTSVYGEAENDNTSMTVQQPPRQYVAQCSQELDHCRRSVTFVIPSLSSGNSWLWKESGASLVTNNTKQKCWRMLNALYEPR